MGIQINGNTNNINAGIGSLSIEDIRELDITGVATAANFKTGVSNLHDVGLTLSGGQIDVGSNIKIGTAGVITATSFVGSGANLTGISAGTSLSGSTNNTVCTVTGANAIQGEANLTFNGNTLNISGSSDDGRVSIVGHEGYDARLSLIADQGDDHIDQWNIRSKASNNTLTIDQFGGGTFNTRLTIASDANNGDVTVNTGDLIIGTAGKGVDFPNSSLFESSVNMHLDIASGNNDFYIRSGGTTFAAFKGQSKDLQLTSGNLVIGTSGKGIDFSATANASVMNEGFSTTAPTMDNELLKTYERGTWTGHIRGYDHTGGAGWGNVATTAGTNSATGRYIRIGNLVTCFIKFSGITWDTNWTYFSIIGVPFGHNHYDGAGGFCLAQDTNSFTNTGMTVMGNVHGSQGLLVGQQPNGTTNLTLDTSNSNRIITASMVFYTSSGG